MNCHFQTLQLGRYHFPKCEAVWFLLSSQGCLSLKDPRASQLCPCGDLRCQHLWLGCVCPENRGLRTLSVPQQSSHHCLLAWHLELTFWETSSMQSMNAFWVSSWAEKKTCYDLRETFWWNWLPDSSYTLWVSLLSQDPTMCCQCSHVCR